MTNPATQPPTLYEWAGGMPAFERLTKVFYERVLADPLIGPLFAHMNEKHPTYVAHFLAEVFKGPEEYSAERGGHHTMLAQHLNKRLTQEQRSRWVQLLLTSADDAGLPADPEFRSAFVSYIEWGTRLAVLNSQDDANPTLEQPMPKWGWGEVKGPYAG
ncbi:MAG: group II truncated hemoglobin [bacterium]